MRTNFSRTVVLCGALLFLNGLSFADEIVLTSGQKGTGTIVSENQTSIEIETVVKGKKVKRIIPKNRVYSIEQNGKVRILNEGALNEKNFSKLSSENKENAAVPRSPKEVVALIERGGAIPPDWLKSTPLDYPKTLDLSFPQNVDGWDNQRNFGQYVWDVINPNPNRWKGGVKLAEFLRTKNADNPETIERIDQATGEFYFRFFQDYVHAAYYWRLSGLDKNPEKAPWLTPYLGECYWRLGSKEMALELFEKAPDQYPWIKVLADMGELDRALKVAESLARTGVADFAYQYAGDACRTAGDFDRAIEYYQKVLSLKPTPQRTAEQMERNTKRARANIAGIQAFHQLDLSKVRDGSYEAESVGFAGQVRVKVTAVSGRITAVEVVDHQEKQYYSSIQDVPRQIVKKQNLMEVDAVSSATATSEAIVNATGKALLKGLE